MKEKYRIARADTILQLQVQINELIDQGYCMVPSGIQCLDESLDPGDPETILYTREMVHPEFDSKEDDGLRAFRDQIRMKLWADSFDGPYMGRDKTEEADEAVAAFDRRFP